MNLKEAYESLKLKFTDTSGKDNNNKRRMERSRKVNVVLFQAL